MRWILSAVGLAFLAPLAFAADAPQDAKVTLKRLIEKRELSLEKTPFSGWENGIELQLHVDGAAVKGARKVGKLKVAEASDDAGTDLNKKPKDAPRFENDDFQEVREPQSFSFGNDNAPKPTGFDVDVKLPMPSARGAKSIKLVRGEMQVLVGGEKKVVEVKSLKNVYGKVLDDPALKAAGVSFTVLDPTNPKNVVGFGRDEEGKSVPVMMSGDLTTIAEVQFVNKAGEKLNQGWMSESGQPANRRSLTYNLSEPLTDDVKLQIEVWPGQKTLTVPFELKDVKLP